MGKIPWALTSSSGPEFFLPWARDFIFIINDVIVNNNKNAWFLSSISSEKLKALNIFHEGVPVWNSFHSWDDWSNVD